MKSSDGDKYFDAALNAWDFNNYLSIHKFESRMDNERFLLPIELRETLDPELIFLMRQAEKRQEEIYETLSQEAKDLINLILERPEEISNTLGFAKNRKLTVNRIAMYIKKKLGKKQTTFLLNEIATYATVLESL